MLLDVGILCFVLSMYSLYCAEHEICSCLMDSSVLFMVGIFTIGFIIIYNSIFQVREVLKIHAPVENSQKKEKAFQVPTQLLLENYRSSVKAF